MSALCRSGCDIGRFAALQGDSEGGTAFEIVVANDRATVGVNNHPSDRETYPEAIRFCGEERFKKRVVEVLRQTGARVAHWR